MNLQKLALCIFFIILSIGLLVVHIGETRNIDPQCGYEEGTELCNGHLYAKVNELKSADNCDDEADDPDMNINEEFLKGCQSFFK
ncbi:hypothetical protein [Acinetobacter baumannii]|uniref:hypothetical protein n=1 Tax=Acinetobacter baumannii TaxID=470 RepID=UPI000F745C70|nr:hypothetical protein [Acinetobacter baumannii]RSQ72097.1 hypothetical protein EA696_03945 [Acinetobacter baumannii]